MFKRNEGNTDRIIRLVLAVVLFVVALATQSIIIGVIAIIPLATALIGWCPLYTLFGLSTLGRGSKQN